KFVARLALRYEPPARGALGGLGRADWIEAEWRRKREMALLVNHRIVRIGMLIISSRQQHRGAEEHRMAPERSEQLALDLDALHPLGVGRQRARRQRARQS